MSTSEEYSESMTRLRSLLSIEPNELPSYSDALLQASRALHRLPDIARYFTEGEVHRKLETVVYEILSAKKTESDRQTLLEEKLRRLLSNFRARIGSWKIVAPLDNLTLPGRGAFRIGNVTFFRFSERRLLKALAQIRVSLLQNPRYANNAKFIDQYVDRRRKHDIGALVGKICAETEVFGRSDDAFDDALPKMEEAIAGLKLFHYVNDDFYGRYFGILGRVVARVLRSTLLYPRGSGFIGSESAWVGPRFEFKLDGERLGYMRKNGLLKLTKILSKQERTDVEQRIVSSMLWFARATDVILSDNARIEMPSEVVGGRRRARRPQAEMMAPYDRLLKLVVSLEALLILDQSEPVQSNLAERTALLVGRNYPQRKQIASFVKEIYRKRSGVVHHGGKEISESELAQLTYLAQTVIITLLKNLQRLRLTSDDSLREWFLKKKLS